ncbi:Sperm-associated antigen 17, partial [Irineochytrium annulatum]
MASKHKEKPVSQTTQFQNIPLNDETWKAFVFAIIPDCNGHFEHPAALPLMAQLYDQIGTGIRQKFTTLGRASLLSWALDNVKTNDVCKEVKGLVDLNPSDPDVPDLLMGRLIKIKLLALKQEGIEGRNVAKVQRDMQLSTPPAVEPSEAPKGGKAAPKKDDKDKGNAKAAAGKKNAKGKQPEPPSRPESAQLPAEVSKRKGKLRERGTKTEAKPVTIGDEPEGGPDVYYLLKDFNMPGVLNALMDDNDILVNAIFTVD